MGQTFQRFYILFSLNYDGLVRPNFLRYSSFVKFRKAQRGFAFKNNHDMFGKMRLNYETLKKEF